MRIFKKKRDGMSRVVFYKIIFNEKSMIDSIGLGNFLANVITVFLLLIILIGFILLKKKSKNVSWIWLSCSLNITSFLYFMGDTSYIIPILNIFIWPVINIILIIWYVRSKKH